MDENRKAEQKINDSVPISDTDLLTLTVRSLDLKDSTPQEDDFLDSMGDNVVEISKQRKEETKTFAKGESKELKMIDLNEVAWHDTEDNCWIVIYDFVYDCTDFLKSHPGGLDVILEYAGRDATFAFIDTGHSSTARETLETYLIGELPLEERIFRVPHGVKITGFL